MKYFRQAHCIYHNQYHIVFIPRFRRKFMMPAVAKYLTFKLDEVRKHYPDIVYLERNIQPDHVHLLVVIPPRMAVSQAVNIIKSNTSSSLRKQFKFLAKMYADGGGIWSVGYFCSTVGINENVIKRYIRMQGREDSGQAKLAI